MILTIIALAAIAGFAAMTIYGHVLETKLSKAENEAAHQKRRADAYEQRCCEVIDERNEAVQALHLRIGQEVCGTWIRPAFGSGYVKGGRA